MTSTITPEMIAGLKNITNIVERARVFAAIAHANQTYGGGPYTAHLHDVVLTLEEFGHDGKNMKAAGYVHDVVEDCGVEYATLVDVFNEEIAEMVYCVSNEPGANRKERHLKTYPKIRSNAQALALKLADRISNVKNCILTDNAKYDGMYKKEHAGFKAALYCEGQHAVMWKWLDFLLSK